MKIPRLIINFTEDKTQVVLGMDIQHPLRGVVPGEDTVFLNAAAKYVNMDALLTDLGAVIAESQAAPAAATVPAIPELAVPTIDATRVAPPVSDGPALVP